MIIKKLTKEQEESIPAFIQKWVSKASGEADRVAAANAVRSIYKGMGEEEPVVIFGESPFSTAIMASLSSSPKDNDSQLHSQLYSQLRSQLHSQLYSQLDSQLYSQLDSQLYSQLYKIYQNSYTSIFWLAWSGWYDYGQYIGVEFDKKAYELFMTFAENVGFIIPYKGVAFVSDKPISIRWINGLLSYDHGKSVEYADGWGIYSLDGVNLNEDEWGKIVNQEFTLETLAKAEMGADKSAVAIKYLKPDLLLKQVGAKLISVGVHDGTELYQVDDFMGTGDTEYCMKMQHPTIKDQFYIEWVEPSIAKNKDADMAQAVAFQITKRQYLRSINK